MNPAFLGQGRQALGNLRNVDLAEQAVRNAYIHETISAGAVIRF
jgi:hypothetical protein